MRYYYATMLEHFVEKWYGLNAKQPSHEAVHNRKENDKELGRIKLMLIQLLEENRKGTQDLSNPATKVQIKKEITTFMTKVLGMDSWVCALLDDEGYYESTAEFHNRAHQLCPHMPLSDLTQGLRNMWVFNALQVYMDVPVKLTDAAFAYSMLYPLTDNYMDNPEIDKASKQSFNKRFHEKIETGLSDSYNDDEIMIFHMIDLIAGDYSRETHPDIFKSLLAILDAQNRSLDQHNPGTVFELDLLRHTFYKGGTSVLADAYLVKGHLTETEARFAFGYGVALQLADDFEDIDSDMACGHHTLPNTQARLGKLDDLFNRYTAFSHMLMDEYFSTSTKKQLALSQLLNTSMEYLLMGNVFKSRRHFGKLYLKHFNQQSRFSYNAYMKHNRKLQSLLNRYPKAVGR